ncbi:hypothetical protein BGZ51_005594 [Haplosporangium sp. Z 767]|nr:hypothetical protein BGZ51_005594 [Haplosporangium sp. Z 767]
MAPLPQQQPHRKETSNSSMNHRRLLSKLNTPSSSSLSSRYRFGGDENTHDFHERTYRKSSFSSRTAPPPRTLSEELSMALQNTDNDNSLQSTPGLLSSAADVSTASSSSVSSATAPSSHFPLFKSSLTSQQQGSAGHKSRSSSFSLYHNNHPGQQYEAETGERSSPSFQFRADSPTSAISRNSINATDIAGSPLAPSATAAATLGVSSSSWMSQSHNGQAPSVSMSSAASTCSSSYYSNTSSPRALSSPCSSLCQYQSRNHHHPACPQKQHQHHPACQYHPNHQPQQEQWPRHGPKPERATKGIQRWGLPVFRPEMDSSFMGSNGGEKSTRTTSTSTSSSGYGIRRNRDEADDEDAMGGQNSSYASEPPKKRHRSTASMLLDAAFETVIFTGAVALSAYQLLTGKGILGGHSKNSSTASDDTEDSQNRDAKSLEEDPMEEKLALQMDAPSVNNTPRTLRTYSSTGTLSRTPRMSGYYKARTPRSYRSRQSYSSSGHSHHSRHHSGHGQSFSMPVRPNTGTEDTDEAFLRMEAQLNNLIAEGKRALNSRIEVWDE